MDKLISIIMPVYNGEEFILEAIKSVMKQSYKNWELLIINDGSTDNTEEIIKSFIENNNNIKYYSLNKNFGKVTAVNKGFELSKGDYISLFAADDVMIENSLESRLNFLIDNGLSAIFSDLYICDQNLNIIKTLLNYKDTLYYWEKDYKRILWDNFIPGGSILLKKNLAQNIFPIPNKLSFEDWWLSFNILIKGYKIGFLKKPLLKYRIHTNNDNGSLNIKNIDFRIKKNYKRHLAYYEEFINIIDNNSFGSSYETIRTLVEVNKNMKEKIIMSKFIFPNLKFIKNYGFIKYIDVLLTSMNISYLPRKLLSIIKMK